MASRYRLRSTFIAVLIAEVVIFFTSRRGHTRWPRDWSSDVCSSDLTCDRSALLASSLLYTLQNPLFGGEAAKLCRPHFGVQISMPSHSDVGPLLSLNLRPSGNASSGSVAPARRADSSASSFQHWLTSPQGNAAKDVGRAKTQAPASSTQERTPNQVQSALLKEKGSGAPGSGNESESNSGLRDELPISAPSSLGLAETAEALALPLDVELKGSIEDDVKLEQGLQELIQWLEEGGLEALDSEPGQEQLYALLTQMGLTPAPEQLPHLAMQIRAALSESGSSPKELMASLKTLLSPSGNNGSVQIAAPASGGLEIEPGITRALNDTADFGLTMKAASKIEIGRGGAEAKPPRGETPMVHTALGAEASARDTPLQPSERQFVIQPEVRVPVGQIGRAHV